MTAVATVVPESRATGPRLAWLRDRGMGASILVAALSAAFGVLLVEITAYIGAVLQADPSSVTAGRSPSWWPCCRCC